MKASIYYDNGDVELREIIVGVFHGEPTFGVETEYSGNTEGFVYQDNGEYYYETWNSTLCLGNYMGVLRFVGDMRALGFTCTFL